MQDFCHGSRDSIKPAQGKNGVTIRKVAAGVVSTAILSLASISWGQMHRYPAPPAPADPNQTGPKAQSSKTATRNPVDLERQGRELADLASSIPADIQQVNKGLLPKDMADKLKRIEKLAKQLHGEIGR
jgi:hypothetical protein